MDSDLTQCTSCFRPFCLSDFYLIRAKGENQVRRERICKSCKRAKARNYKQQHSGVTSRLKPALGVVSAVDPSERVDTDAAYKEYKLPDGRTLKLNREEFREIVDVFRVLINAKRKREGRAILLA